MNSLDLVLVLFVIVYAVSGYHQGFLIGAASTFGLLLGGLIGVQVAPALLDRFDQGLSVSTAALLVVIACAFVGQAIGAVLGGQLRRRVSWRPARVADALSGAALSVLAMLLIAWVLGVAASGTPLRSLNEQVRESTVLDAVDGALPGGSDRILSAFSSLVDSTRFPRYLEPFSTERIKDVPAPTARVLRRADVVQAGASVVKVMGAAQSCSRTVEGSGFVFADERVMTNAHVVAGVSAPLVRLDDTDYRSRVVYYDPDVDVAVLYVPGLPARSLAFAATAASSDPAAVLGFPENGPYDAQPARVRDEQTLRSPNIYGDETVYRDTYSIYSLVRQGNSGGPLVDARGRVLGVIFAASLTDSRTGYALTADQVAEASDAGTGAVRGVDSGGCAG
ncbi:MAG: MarP family serine protease [Nocardioidaceae bacterium]